VTLTYIEQIPYVQDEEVRKHALQIFRDSRRTGLSWVKGNATLQHCENVAVTLVRTYTLMGNTGGSEYALLYAKVADLFGALWYFSSGAQRRIEYRHLQSELFPQKV
jgi:hypothetical protein